jgi:hypothetical protein
MKFAGQDTVNEANNFLFKCNSEPVYGSKAFLNTDDFQVNINGFGLGVTFNPSKYLHPFELLTNSDLLTAVCQDVENKLAEACIRLSLNACKVSRVDIAKQSEMPRQVSYYAPAFDQMKFKGVRSNNVNHGAETFSTRNKTVEACFYDKRKAFIINRLENELSILSNKARFIKSIITGKLKVNNVPRKEIILYLEKDNFDQHGGSYQYLLALPIYSLTKETYEALLADMSQKAKELADIKEKQPIDMYREDLNQLKKALQKEYK